MKQYYARKAALLLASLLILIPCVLLLAWEDKLPYPPFLWFILSACASVFTLALYRGERSRRETLSVKRFISKYGGFCVMLCFVVYKFIACCI